MFDVQGKVLYIGKARNLKKRVASYFQKTLTNSRITSLVAQIHHIDVIVTHNENEALLLENQLIKKYHPRYNILLRDDKSYPYIVLSHHEYPRLAYRRQSPTSKNSNSHKNKNNKKHQHHKDEIFGPYPSGLAVRETLKFMQKIFKLRTCHDDFFKHRSRPCLLYQLNKCTAPCVGYISKENYLEDIKNARLLLMGKNQEVISHLISRMEAASQDQQYELAASLRDQISHLRHIQTQQIVTKEKGEIDIFAVIIQQRITAVELLTIRDGNVSGNKIFYPEVPYESTPAEILSAFIPQYYLDNNYLNQPKMIITKEKLLDHMWLEEALKIKIIQAKQGEKIQWIKMAEKTGEEALKAKLAVNQHYLNRLEKLQQLLNLSLLPNLMVCFDISHSSGEATIASCVVFNQSGPLKKAYRYYNIQNIQKNDDYAAMFQVLERYFLKQKILPDIIFIDGGKGQLKQAEKVCEKLNIPDIKMVAISKGPTRKPGLEQLFISGQSGCLDVTPDSEALHLIQYIRDEAHRFAIQSHRKKRAKTRLTSVLETIPGIGAKRRRELLQQLGGLQEIKKASIEQLQKVKGINISLAENIYRTLHEN